MSRTDVIPFASISGRINSRLPPGSLAPVRCACISASPGIRNFPVPSTVLVPLGMDIDFDCPIAAICSSATNTVMLGFGAAPVASINVTLVMAKEGGGAEDEEHPNASNSAENEKIATP